MTQRDRGFSESRLRSRLNWTMSVRLAVALLCLAAIPLTEVIGQFPRAPRYLVLTFACVVNLVYLIAARLGADPRKNAVIQLVMDVVIVTALVYLVGPQRLYVLLYFAVVIGGASVMGLRTALSIAAQASLFLGGVAALYYFYADTVTGLWMVDPAMLKSTDTKLPFLVSYAGAFALGFFAVAVLAGKLSEEVRQIRILNDEILQNMMGGVVAVSRLGEIAYVNAQAKRMLGMPNGKVGADYAKAMDADLAALFKRGLDAGERIEQEIVVNRTPLEISIGPLADGRGGSLRGVVAIVNDLSLRSEVERMTQQAGRFRALLEMSASIAHEIRNPIASIRGAAQELHSAENANEDDRKLLDVVMRESDRLDRIVGEFLEYASDRPSQAALCNLAEVLRETADLLRARDKEGKMKIDLQVPRSIICRGEAERLRIVFVNLGVNALDVIPAGGRLTVRCMPAQAPEGPLRDGAQVDFEDDGPGVPQEHITRVFDPFFTTKPRGTGMGLAIARKIVSEHGGTIAVENLPGRGARFRIWLPAD